MVYAILCLIAPDGVAADVLRALNVRPAVMASFFLLWVGCFLGVSLSYGARTTTMNLNDLINTDADRLLPQVRLLFAGFLTMVFGIFLVLGAIEVKVGGISSATLGHSPMLAFLIGTMCGLSELTLPGSVAKKASDLLAGK